MTFDRDGPVAFEQILEHDRVHRELLHGARPRLPQPLDHYALAPEQLRQVAEARREQVRGGPRLAPRGHEPVEHRHPDGSVHTGSDAPRVAAVALAGGTGELGYYVLL